MRTISSLMIIVSATLMIITIIVITGTRQERQILIAELNAEKDNSANLRQELGNLKSKLHGETDFELYNDVSPLTEEVQTKVSEQLLKGADAISTSSKSYSEKLVEFQKIESMFRFIRIPLPDKLIIYRAEMERVVAHDRLYAQLYQDQAEKPEQ